MQRITKPESNTRREATKVKILKPVKQLKDDEEAEIEEKRYQKYPGKD
ncbi:hypothetical protein GACE_1350 [Geoglobus acetivorans]|uniref:Uncharacterized protein n=1 Tax=Geoglobus acetivorans TaxID=565033 RepID=A0A0A7GHJ9_GEOAI|nr:hypothetical protein GACE_1350 [Geoglobus acetivorans]